MDKFEQWLTKMPKAELHLHIDGSLQAARLLQLAEKNRIQLPYTTIEEVEAAYQFKDLQSFLDLYYLGASVLRDEEDFYHLMMDYLLKCREQNIVHTEIMVEPQTYEPNGVAFETMMNGFTRAINDAESGWEQSTLLILDFLRHLPESDAIRILDMAEPFRDSFVAIGLASSERGNPPGNFVRLYARARAQGYMAVAHAGEEGPPEYIWDSIKELQVQRIDHGVRCVEDERLVDYLKVSGLPLTVCPLSNVRLRVFDTMKNHSVLSLLDRGVKVTINSDDPAYFGGFLNENLCALYRELGLSREQAITLVSNSFAASFLSRLEKQDFIDSLDDYCKQN